MWIASRKRATPLIACSARIDEASIPNQAGTVYRFVHAIKVGDVVVCPDRQTSTLNIGRVSGPYEFHPESDVHKQWRPVEWIRTAVPRDELSYAAQEEISSATTLFQIVTGEDEIGHLLATPQPDTKPDYSWSDFYPRLADALMQFRGDRTALLDKLWAASTASQRPQLFKYLRGDRRVDGSRGPVRDIDPFTVLGSFNLSVDRPGCDLRLPDPSALRVPVAVCPERSRGADSVISGTSAFCTSK